MEVTRREALMGAAAAPALAALPRLDPALVGYPGGRLLVHDPALRAGRSLAQVFSGEALAIEGDRVRFGRALFARAPSMVMGISRPADALLIADVGREAGYIAVSQGEETLRAMLAATSPADKGLVLAWVLAPRR